MGDPLGSPRVASLLFVEVRHDFVYLIIYIIIFLQKRHSCLDVDRTGDGGAEDGRDRHAVGAWRLGRRGTCYVVGRKEVFNRI